jgi:putative SOS response-associated peptidase YedK
MCGRYTLAANPAMLRERFALGGELPLEPRYNIAPGSEVAAVTTDREGAPRGVSLRWGLVPAWAKESAVGFKMINARAETLADKAAYRTPLQRFRCLIPADGFYEWQVRQGLPKQPFHITRADGQPFAFAGLWSVWHRGEEDELRTCTIITTAANGTVAPLHARMPVILDPAAEHDSTPAPAVLELLQSLPADQTRVRAVGAAVNSARIDGPECLLDADEGASIVQDTLFG